MKVETPLLAPSPAVPSGPPTSVPAPPVRALVPSKWVAIAVIAAGSIPVAFLVVFIAVYGVNVAFHDELGMNWFLEGARLGWLQPSHFWQQHNEHRIVFPRLVWLAMLVYLTNWNSKSAMYLSLGMATLSWLAVAGMAWRQRAAGRGGLLLASLAGSSLVYFSVAQYGNWLWAFQMAFFMVNLWVALAVFVATKPEYSLRRRFILGGLFCVAASFSAAHGLLSWLALAPAMWATGGTTKGRARIVALWMGLFAVTAALYSVGFAWPEGNGFPGWRYAVQHPDVAILWFLGLLGNPLTVELGPNRPRVAAAVGAIMLGMYVALIARAMRAKAVRPLAPWIALGLFAILFAGVTAIARSGWGHGGYLSRHATPAVFLTLSVIHGWCALLVHSPVSRAWTGAAPARRLAPVAGQRALAFGYYLVLAGCVVLTVMSTIGVLGIVPRLAADRDLARRVMPFAHYLDPSIDGLRSGVLFPLWPTPGHLKVLPMLDGAARGGFLRLVRDATFSEDAAGRWGRVERQGSGGTSLAAAAPSGAPTDAIAGREVWLSGWALKPGRLKPAELVFLSCQNTHRFLSAIRVRAARPELASQLGVADARIGWEALVSSELLPPGGCELDAWVYDRHQNEFVRLSRAAGKL